MRRSHWIATLSRVFCGVVFIVHGYPKIMNLAAPRRSSPSVGIPGWLAVPVAILEFFGGFSWSSGSRPGSSAACSSSRWCAMYFVHFERGWDVFRQATSTTSRSSSSSSPSSRWERVRSPSTGRSRGGAGSKSPRRGAALSRAGALRASARRRRLAPPDVRLTRAFEAPFANFLATARTCYSEGRDRDVELNERWTDLAKSLIRRPSHDAAARAIPVRASNVSRHFLGRSCTAIRSTTPSR